MTHSYTVLVVDDQLLNIRLLERKLEQAGIRVLSATNGPDGLKIAREDKPHVILLDIMMPEMDGLEVCRRLKQDKITADIPVVFITARNSKEGKIEGLSYGAADYLTKPIDLDETLARVRTQIRIQESHRENLELTRRLEEARRQAAMVHLTEGIAHNLNNLLGVASGYLTLINHTQNNPESLKSSCGKLEQALNRMAKIVHELTSIGQFDSVNTRQVLLTDVLDSALQQFTKSTSSEAQVLVENPLQSFFQLETNPDLLASAIERLLLNGWESYARMKNNTIERTLKLVIQEINTSRIPQISIDIIDNGAGIPNHLRENVFDPFVSTESGVGRGMGLTIARHSLRSLGGDIELIPVQPHGTCARITHPVA